MGNKHQDNPRATVKARAVAPASVATTAATDGRRARRTGARDRILTAAVDLFYREGLRTTGIDRIIAEAGVAKASFYEHFESKDALMEAYVRVRAAAFDEWFDAWMAARFEGLPAGAAMPGERERLLASVDAVADFTRRPDFLGCAFIGAVEQIDDASHPARKAAEGHRQKLRASLAALADGAGSPDPEQLGLSLLMLADGLMVAARAAKSRVERERAAAATRAAWRAVVEAGLAPRTTEPTNH